MPQATAPRPPPSPSRWPTTPPRQNAQPLWTPFPAVRFSTTPSGPRCGSSTTPGGARSRMLRRGSTFKLVGSSFVKGDLIDANFAAGQPDTLWNGSELFIFVQQSGSLAKLYKYTYSSGSGSFAIIGGFPIDLALNGLADPGALALHQDST